MNNTTIATNYIASQIEDYTNVLIDTFVQEVHLNLEIQTYDLEIKRLVELSQIFTVFHEPEEMANIEKKIKENRRKVSGLENLIIEKCLLKSTLAHGLLELGLKKEDFIGIRNTIEDVITFEITHLTYEQMEDLLKK